MTVEKKYLKTKRKNMIGVKRLVNKEEAKVNKEKFPKE